MALPVTRPESTRPPLGCCRTEEHVTMDPDLKLFPKSGSMINGEQKPHPDLPAVVLYTHNYLDK